jgi:hypothetical protein
MVGVDRRSHSVVLAALYLLGGVNRAVGFVTPYIHLPRTDTKALLIFQMRSPLSLLPISSFVCDQAKGGEVILARHPILNAPCSSS